MLNLVLAAMERLALTVIVGGGVVMAAGVRPLLLSILAKPGQPDLAETVEGLSINAWNRYNRFALWAAIVVAVVDLVRIVTGLAFSWWHVGLILTIFVALLGKLLIDQTLKTRLNETGAEAVGSAEQRAGHRRVEFLSVVILVLAVLLVILPF
ncbi:hypothetical protein [Brevibacillus aydinogluensis]|jgi:hypothetical protein|uniref:DUF2269 domain-containing protein n=1 Tax=Brevibacillus aydinogluensis TaxID=927786 RepID=A0AA48M7B0_9BACL|nr:hypothetical protein [Brevibacillus aydinogluensis]CAJ1000844.1 DUF2269 domain-containing protein [Brevibacillus aydinogluensis]